VFYKNELGERLKKDSEKDEKNSIANFLQASSK
jgi:hypothetical protein